jgi:drug efflux transport system ATP-binding protein
MMQPVIAVEHLTKKFGDFTAVNDISFEVYAGEIFGFIGANGAGKTTAMKMLCGLLKSTSGNARVAGFDVNIQPEKVKQCIGYMSQRFSLYEDLTIKENFEFYGGVYGLKKTAIRQRLNDMLEKFSLKEEVSTLVGSLPLGWKQKLSFSLAMLHDPKIVFLDEPTGGVDPITRRQFWDLIYEASHHGITIFVTTHYMDEAEYCNRLSIMVDGSIKALDKPANLRKEYHADTMDGVFQVLARGTSTK